MKGFWHPFGASPIVMNRLHGYLTLPVGSDGKNEEHSPRNEKNKEMMFREILSFFDQYIGDNR